MPLTDDEKKKLEDRLAGFKDGKEKAEKRADLLTAIIEKSLGALDGDKPDLKSALAPLAKSVGLEVKDWPEFVKKEVPKPEVPAEFKEQWATMQKSREADQERIVKLEKAALDQEYLTKAEKDFAHVPGLPLPELAVMVRKAHDGGIGEDFEKLLKAVEGAMAKNPIFVEKGSGLSDDGTDAMAKMETLALEKMQKSTEPLSRAAALTQVSRENPELRRAAQAPQQ